MQWTSDFITLFLLNPAPYERFYINKNFQKLQLFWWQILLRSAWYQFWTGNCLLLSILVFIETVVSKFDLLGKFNKASSCKFLFQKTRMSSSWEFNFWATQKEELQKLPINLIPSQKICSELLPPKVTSHLIVCRKNINSLQIIPTCFLVDWLDKKWRRHWQIQVHLCLVGN